MEEEIAKTVKEQVDAQIVNHIPIPLKKQLVDCQAQLKHVEVSLTNSKARGIHAYYELSPDSLDEPLKPFVDASGRTSDVYPADLSSLFTYDIKNLKKLVSDYGLVPDNDRLSNINRFMDHIGIKHRLETITIGKQ
ncbi:hypothetical protein L218DRAFT_525296 [Marasmius fiardii PR-910]|nr:hypothetical protein L218DRAFT_525296 [Marasmius fiardii PR-910]